MDINNKNRSHDCRVDVDRAKILSGSSASVPDEKSSRGVCHVVGETGILLLRICKKISEMFQKRCDP